MGRRLQRFQQLNGLASDLNLSVANRSKLLLSTYLHRASARFPSIPEATFRVSFRYSGKPVTAVIRSNDVDSRLLENLLVRREYAVTAVAPRRILDLGGNIGIADLLFHALYPDAEIVTVEPIPSNLKVLRLNWGANNIRGRILDAAVSDRTGTTQFYVGGPDNSSLFPQPWMSGAAIEVKCVTVPEIMKLAGWDEIDIMKLDIEGAERLLLKSSADWAGKVKIIVGELHDGYTVEEFSRDLGGRFQCRQVFEKHPLRGVVATRAAAAAH
jgi:FkbM family methyltransferase